MTRRPVRTRVAGAAPPVGGSEALPAVADAGGDVASYVTELRRDGPRWTLDAQARVPEIDGGPGLVPAVENAVRIVRHINRTPPQSLSLAEITTALGISKSHCHSILKTLTHFGWLRFDARAKTYELNAGLLAAASSLLASPVLARIGVPLLALSQRVNLAGLLLQVQADESFVVVNKFNAATSMDFSFPIGHMMPRDTTAASRALLAWQSPERIDAWMSRWRPVRYTSSSLVSEDAVRTEIAATRARGYARSVGELTEGLMALGMPVFDTHGDVAYVFTFSGLLTNLASREEAVAREIVQTAIEINHIALGRVPADFPKAVPGRG